MKIKVKYSCPMTTVRVKPKKVKSRGPGFRSGGRFVTRKEILKDPYLSSTERMLLLDMCKGVTVKKVKKIKKRNFRKLVTKRPIAHYLIDGTIYNTGDITEVSSFWGI